jgi:hypothetical protein
MQYAIMCENWRGPAFGYGKCDLAVGHDPEITSANSTKSFGHTYDFNTELIPGIDPPLFLTGQPTFAVQEIEVFEITD